MANNNVAVITDSISCIPKEFVEQYGIVIVPIRFLVQGKVYRDLVDITPSEAYDLFLKDPKNIKTTPLIRRTNNG